MSELFDIPESISPRLAWIKKHQIETEEFSDSAVKSGMVVNKWVCRTIQSTFPGSIWAPKDIAGGETEDAAIVAWAKAHGAKLWNEETK